VLATTVNDRYAVIKARKSGGKVRNDGFLRFAFNEDDFPGKEELG
jgi:hypothetical protein